MRRDIVRYFEAPVDVVFEAYLKTASEKPFERSCSVERYHTITFGLGMSFIYNMNGGACTIHFAKYNSGTAVDVRFSIVQLVGARYKQYEMLLFQHAQSNLGVVGVMADININYFIDGRNKVYDSGYMYKSSQSTQYQQYYPNPQPGYQQPQYNPNPQPEYQQTVVTQHSYSIPEEIAKLTDLLNKGILTREEFEAAKRRVLGAQ